MIPECKGGMLTIRHAPKQSGVRVADGTRFLLEDGSELTQVAECVVEYKADCIVTATLTVAFAPTEDITAHPLLNLKSVKEAALYYGYDLAKLPGFVRAIDGEKIKA
jgi:hypothetical protein